MEYDIQRQKNHEDSGSLLYPHSVLQQRDNDNDEHLVWL